jgi:hypothetical protein
LKDAPSSFGFFIMSETVSRVAARSVFIFGCLNFLRDLVNGRRYVFGSKLKTDGLK